MRSGANSGRLTVIIGVRGLVVDAISDDAKAFYLALGMIPSRLDPMTLTLTLCRPGGGCPMPTVNTGCGGGSAPAIGEHGLRPSDNKAD